MKTVLNLVKEKIGKPYVDLEFLLDAFKEVLVENGESDVVKSIPFGDHVKPIDVERFSSKHIQLYSIVYQIINIVEINAAVQDRRSGEEGDLSSTNGLWAKAFHRLKEIGVGENEIAEELKKTYIEPVLTAHPTEAKRTTVLEHHRELYLLMVQRENTMYNRYDLANIRENIKMTLYKLWKTGEIFIEKPDIDSELRNMLHYFLNVFPEIMPIIDKRMLQAWEYAGFDKNIIDQKQAYPNIRFGNWVGGDRDGHPLVTANVTANALNLLRLNAFIIIRRKLLKLVKDLSFALALEDAPAYIKDRMAQMNADLGERAVFALNRNKSEVFRQYLNLMLTKLPLEVARGHATSIKEREGSYQYAKELLDDLLLLQQSLIDYGAKSVAYNSVKDTIRAVATFGFSLAELDIRQNSAFHDKAISQLMTEAGLDGSQYPDAEEQWRVDFINKELAVKRPFSHCKSGTGENASAVLEAYRVVEEHIMKYGTDGIGYFIVSMTRSLSDLLGVYLLAREAGLTKDVGEGVVSLVPIAPLLETVEDLMAGPEILDAFLAHPFTKRTLEYQRVLKGLDKPTQLVMVGYSDSNKDGGIIASQWNLSKAQSMLTQVGEKHGVVIKYFHGKGGTISRGAGPTHYFVNALPQNTLEGGLRLTEQGETIERKYANKVNAAYNFELMSASTVLKNLEDKHENKVEDATFNEVMSWMAGESSKTYKKLLHEEGFIEFFRQATPIDAIENSKIGSRPSRRTGTKTLDDLRAIPWVFSWSQNRFNMTSWYGVGTTLENLKKQRPEHYQWLKKEIKVDPFIRYLFTNIDTSLAATDEGIMEMYCDLVENKDVKEKFSDLFFQELRLTKSNMNDLLEMGIEERRVQHYYSNKLRGAMMGHLHAKQIDLLKKWRKVDQDNPLKEELLLDLLTTINAVSGGLGQTG